MRIADRPSYASHIGQKGAGTENEIPFFGLSCLIMGKTNGQEWCFANDASVLPAMVDAVERFGAEHACPADLMNDVHIVLDELFSNIIAYGYSADQKGTIIMRLNVRHDTFIVEVDDDGRHFDLTQAPAPDLQASLPERKVGGVGIHFIRSLMDDVTYTRCDGLNRVRLTKRLPTAAGRVLSRRNDGAA